MKPLKFRSLTPHELAESVAASLEARSIGQEDCHLAWRFAKAVEDARLDTEQVQESCDRGELIEAFLLANAEPSLAEILSSLRTVDMDTWMKVSQHLQRPFSDLIADDAGESVFGAFPKGKELSDWLMSEYKSRIEEDDMAGSYPIIKHIASLPDASEEVQKDFVSAGAELLQQCEGVLQQLLERDASAEDISAELEFFRSYDLRLRDSGSEIVARALAAEKTFRKTLTKERLQEFIDAVPDAETLPADITELELQYFGVHGMIWRQELHSSLPIEMISRFDHLGLLLGEKRYEIETRLKDSAPFSVVEMPIVEDDAASEAAAETPEEVAPFAEEEEEAPAVAQEVRDSVASIESVFGSLDAEPEPEPAVIEEEAKPEEAVATEAEPVAAEAKVDAQPDAVESKTPEPKAETPEPVAEKPEEPVPAEKSAPAEAKQEATPVKKSKSRSKKDRRRNQNNKPAEKPVVAAQAQPVSEKAETPKPQPAKAEASKKPVAAKPAAKKAPEPKKKPLALLVGAPVGIAAAVAFFAFSGGSDSEVKKQTAATPVAQVQEAKPEPVVVEEAYVNEAFDNAAATLREQLQTDYSDELATKVEALFDVLRTEIPNMPADVAKESDAAVVAMAADWTKMKEAHLDAVQIEASRAIEKVRTLSRALARETDEERFADLMNSLEGYARTAQARIDECTDCAAQEAQFQTALQQIAAAKAEQERIAAYRKGILGASDFDSFFAQLEKLAASKRLPDAERAAVERAQVLKFHLPGALGQLRSSGVEVGDVPAVDSETFLNEALVSTFSERAKIKRLVEVAEFQSKLVTGKELYFKGGKTPFSSKELVMMGKPKEKVDSSGKSTTAVSITPIAPVLGETLNRTYIEDQFGNPWGYRFEDVETPVEAAFAKDKLLPVLRSAGVQAPRRALIDLVEELRSNTEVSPRFNAFWTQSIQDVLRERPKERGIAFSPSLLALDSALAALPAFRSDSWIFDKDDAAADAAFEKFVADRRSATPAIDEIDLVLALTAFARECQFQPVGYYSMNKQPIIRDDLQKTGEALWVLDAITGQPVPLDPKATREAYTPVFQPVYGNEGVNSFRQRQANDAGADLESPDYEGLLPTLFKG